jgi:hypothetical protein
MMLRKDGIEPMTRVNAGRGILAELPEICTRNWMEDLLAPKTACAPVQPYDAVVRIDRHH